MKAMLFGSAAAALALAACAGNVAGSGSGGAGGLPACTWPASLDPTDASGGKCTAARAYLVCADPSGGQVGCISDDPTRCPGTAGYGCKDQCNADEYGAVCGQVGPGPEEAPPAGCRLVGPTPAGIAFYCCPCGA
jgi:hypothetical protein